MLSSIFKEALRAFKHRSAARAEAGSLRRLAARFPRLAALPAVAADSVRLIAAPYEQYVTSVSSPEWAISLRTAALLRGLCGQLEPAAVLDLGSGFSSFVLRLYARDATRRCTVHSVDESADWLERTRRFLAQHGLPADDVFPWSEFQARPAARYDLILHDMGRMPFRLDALPHALGLAAPDGFVILDDMHNTKYAPQAVERCRLAGFEVCSVRAITLDEFGRFACLAYPGAR